MKSIIFSLLIILTIILMTNCASQVSRSSLEADFQFVQLYPVMGDPVDFDVSKQCVFVAEDEVGFSIIDKNSSNLIIRVDEFSFIQIRSVPLVKYNHDFNILFVVDRSMGHVLYSLKIDSLSTSFEDYATQRIIGSAYNVRDIAFSNIIGDSIRFNMFLTNFKYDQQRNEFVKGTYNSNAIENPLTMVPTAVPNAVLKIKLTDNYIATAMGQRGLYFLSREELTEISQISTPGEARDMVINGNIIYIADRQHGLQVLDVSDIYNPLLLQNSSRSTDGFATSIDMSDRFLAVGSGSGGVYLYDISNPAVPILINRLEEDQIGYVHKVMFFERDLYIASRTKGIVRYQIK